MARTLDRATATRAVGLPPLREEVELLRGPELPDGAPSWHLFDPVRNRFFRIGWTEFEILLRWPLGDPEAIAVATSRETPLQVTPAAVASVLHFLAINQLLVARGPAALAGLEALARLHRERPAQFLLHRYLMFRIPLWRPDAFLSATLPWLRGLFRPGTLLALAGLALLGLYLVSRQWSAFRATFLHLETLEGVLLIGVAIFLAKAVHELGHAYAAKYYGLRVPVMGIALIVGWPVLFTETSEAWKLRARRPRLVIGAAGMLAELGLAGLATLAWALLPEGAGRSAAFLIATTTWVLTLLINLNPFMRFDGYYLLSDLSGVQNLQERAFALGRRRLRQLLLGLAQPDPEPGLPEQTKRHLVWYAWGVWLYRFFLFLGIALLVYHAFFKLLGLFLMAVELGWFIVRPVLREITEWVGLRGALRWNRQLAFSLMGLTGVVLLLVVPWRGQLDLPAVSGFSPHTTLYAPEGAQIAAVPVRLGQQVAAGAPLLRLRAPDLGQALAQARRRLAVARLEVERHAVHRGLMEDLLTAQRGLAEAETRVSGLEARLARMQLLAPQAGRVVFLQDDLHPGRWVAPELPLLRLLDPAGLEVTAFTREEALARLGIGARGRFYADEPGVAPLPVRLVQIAPTNTTHLDLPCLASEYGGPLATRRDGARLVPEEALYRLRLEPLDPSARLPLRRLRGEVRLEVPPSSLLGRFWRHALAVLLRESGF